MVETHLTNLVPAHPAVDNKDTKEEHKGNMSTKEAEMMFLCLINASFCVHILKQTLISRWI